MFVHMYNIGMSDDLIKQLETIKNNNGWSYSKLAREMDIPETYITRWFKHSKPISMANQKLIQLFINKHKSNW